MGNLVPVRKKAAKASVYMSLPSKMDASDPYSTSIEMESLSERNGHKKWLDGNAQLDTVIKGVFGRRFKPVLLVAFSLIIVIIVVVVVLHTKSSHTNNSFAKQQDLLELEQQFLSLQQNFLQVGDQLSDRKQDLVELKQLLLSLQQNLSQFSDQFTAVHNNVQQLTSRAPEYTSLSERLGQLESGVGKLRNEMHNALNLYKNCKEDTESCSIDPDKKHTNYWRDCPTRYLPLHEEVYLIIHRTSYQNLHSSFSYFIYNRAG